MKRLTRIKAKAAIRFSGTFEVGFLFACGGGIYSHRPVCFISLVQTQHKPSWILILEV